ncbi:MAG TPA: sodium/glutamate symporter [Chthoniobacteraceae bacterium]|nr:sodium/glutamate symporter [Chthoniobacteraceae bacterium]
MSINLNAFVSFTLAIVLYFLGRDLNQRIAVLRRYSIPEPVAGGLFCAVCVSLIYVFTGYKVTFTLDVQDALLLYFFAGIGLSSDIHTLRSGGKSLLFLTLLASFFMVLQNGVGMACAAFFGFNPKAGLLTGSVALTGGVGTTIAWAPDFVQHHGIANAMELGVASNMIGLIAACVVGGPIAGLLIRRHRLSAPQQEPTLQQALQEDAPVPIDSNAVLRAWLWLNIALLIGHGISAALGATGLTLPGFVGCLLAGIFLRNAVRPFFRSSSVLQLAGARQGLSLISDICLGMFLTMALMGLRFWELQGNLLFITTTLLLQITLAVLFALVVIYRAMGRDYEAAVMAAGFGGISLGSTATAVANMTAVTREHGAAPRAFLVVPLVCGFFIDLINAVVINVMAGG